MKKIALIAALFVSFSASAQFQTIDSLRNFVNRYIRNSAVESFTNLRLNTAMNGLIRFVDSARSEAAGIVSASALNDSTIRIITTVDTFDVTLATGGGGGGTNNSNLGSGFRVLITSSQGLRTLTNGYAIGIDSTSNSNALTFKADTGLLTTRGWHKKGIDSLAALIPAPGSTYTPGSGIRISGTDISLKDTVQAKIWDKGGGGYHVDAYGLVGDGSTDNSAALRAMLNTLKTTGGKIIFGRGTYRFNSAIDIPFVANILNPYSATFVFEGQGAHWDAQSTVAINAATTIEFNLSNNYLPAMSFRGRGHFVSRGINYQNVSTSININFFKTTNTHLDFQLNSFIGGGAATSYGAKDTVFVLGGTNLLPTDSSRNSAFQGYASNISFNFFDKLERAVLLQTYANANTFLGNTLWNNCGGETAFEIIGDATNGTATNKFAYNLIETPGYKYGFKNHYAANNTFVDNDFYDPGDSVRYQYYFDATCSFNYVKQIYFQGAATKGILDLSASTEYSSSVAGDTSRLWGPKLFHDLQAKNQIQLFESASGTTKVTLQPISQQLAVLIADNYVFTISRAGSTHKILMNYGNDTYFQAAGKLRLLTDDGGEIYIGSTSYQNIYVINDAMYFRGAGTRYNNTATLGFSNNGTASADTYFKNDSTNRIGFYQSNGSYADGKWQTLTATAKSGYRTNINGTLGINDWTTKGYVDSVAALGGTIDATPTNGSTNAVQSDGVFDALALKAPLASPALTGTPTVPTAAAGTNTTQAASTAFVQAALSTFESTLDGNFIRELTTTGTTTTTIDTLSVSADSSFVYSVVLMAKKDDNTIYKSERKVTVKNIAGAITAPFVETVGTDQGEGTWTVTISVDDTVDAAGGPLLRVAGMAATNIYWTVTVSIIGRQSLIGS